MLACALSLPSFVSVLFLTHWHRITVFATQQALSVDEVDGWRPFFTSAAYVNPDNLDLVALLRPGKSFWAVVRFIIGSVRLQEIRFAQVRSYSCVLRWLCLFFY